MKVIIFLTLTFLSFISHCETTIYTVDLEKECLNLSSIEMAVFLIYTDQDEPLNDIKKQFGNKLIETQNLTGKALNAYKKLKKVTEFFHKEFSWDSVDSENTPILLLTNLSTKFKSGEKCDSINASYLSISTEKIRMISVLQGNPNNDLDIADDVEVLAHEFAHGIFQKTQRDFDKTDAMNGINEAIADMFGVSFAAWNGSGYLKKQDFDNETFKIGLNTAKIAKSFNLNYPKDVLRDLAHPDRYYTKDHMNQYYKDKMPNGDLEEHELSGIASLPFVLMVKGGNHPRLPNLEHRIIKGMGFKKAINIVFYALEKRFKFNTMPQFAQSIKKASRKIYGKKSCEYQSVSNAFAEVGLISQTIKNQCIDVNIDSSSTTDTSIKSKPLFKLNSQTLVYGLISLVIVLLFFIIKPAKKIVTINEIDNIIDNKKVENITKVVKFKALNFSSGSSQGQIKLNTDPIKIGRAYKNINSEFSKIIDSDTAISKEHCAIWLDDDFQYLYIYNCSRNGIKLNGNKLQYDEKTKVSLDDEIEMILGRTKIVFS